MDLKKYKKVIGKDFSKDADLIDTTIKTMNLAKDSRILDVGTGMGAMSILLALNGFHVITGQPGHDPEWEEYCNNRHEPESESEHNHEHHGPASYDWRENAKALNVLDLIEYIHLDAQDLNFLDETFDAVFLYDALQHIENKTIALNECIRVIKPQGIVCVIEWNKKTVDSENEEFGYDINYVDPRNEVGRKDISIELEKGDHVNIFIIKRIEKGVER
jgi:SAM-dependent methyltransferase